MNKFFLKIQSAAKFFLLLVPAFTLITACSDDDTPADEAWSIELIGDNTDGLEAVIDMFGRYYSINTAQNGNNDLSLALRSEAAWLTLMTDTLPADGILQLRAEANTEARERSASIYVESSDHPNRRAVITIRQRSEASYGDNADADPLSDYRVGWGFSAFDEYLSLNSIRGKIIDEARLMSYDSDSTFHCFQEVRRGREEYSVFTSLSLQEMSMKLTEDMVKSTDFLGAKKTTRRHSEVCTSDVRDHSCAYARLQKTVGSRSIDEGVLRFIVSQPESELAHGLPFTEDFLTVYRNINGSSGKEQEDAIAAMLNTYGTHLVINASVGCMIDLALTFTKGESYDLDSVARKRAGELLGRTPISVSPNQKEYISSNYGNKNSIEIAGGSDETRNALVNAARNLTSSTQLSPELVRQWLASVNTSALDNNRKNLDVVDFQFMPIWELFTDNNLKGRIQQQVIDMSDRSDCSFTNKELAIDNYLINLANTDFSSFGTDGNASLVRVARINDDYNTPILEICQEYVPKIRSDRRITVYYPIFEGRTRIGQGLFPGDGEGNPPAVLTFSDGDVYVNPIDGYGTHEKVTTAYYIHGNLYTKDYEAGIDRNKTITAADERLTLNGGSYPIVKIGSGYWTRKNIDVEMQFGITYRGRFQIRETIIGSMLYAQIFGSNQPLFLSNFADIYGTTTDELTGKATLWYLPTLIDKESLTFYLGFNHKSLMKGQPSGFEADFAGYYGSFDPKTGNDLVTAELRDNGQYCYVPFKSTIQGQDGEALVLAPDYSWQSYNITASHNNYFPVRLFRTCYYKYPTN